MRMELYGKQAVNGERQREGEQRRGRVLPAAIRLSQHVCCNRDAAHDPKSRRWNVYLLAKVFAQKAAEAYDHGIGHRPERNLAQQGVFSGHVDMGGGKNRGKWGGDGDGGRMVGHLELGADEPGHEYRRRRVQAKSGPVPGQQAGQGSPDWKEMPLDRVSRGAYLA